MSIDAYDPLYLDRIRLMKLGCSAPPMVEADITHLRTLLRLVNHIIRPQQYKGEKEKLQAKTTPKQFLMQDRANDIGRQLAFFKGEKSKTEKKTWKILEDSPDIPLKTMAILSLVAFATMYGRVQLVTTEQDDSSNPQLKRSIALLKQQRTTADPIKNWSNTLKTVLSRALDVAARVMDLPETHGRSDFSVEEKNLNKKLLASSVHKIVNVVIICWSQVVDILIKRSRETLWRKSALLESNLWSLENKLGEIKSLFPNPNDTTPKAKAANNDKVSSETAASEDGDEKQISKCSYWWKLRQMMMSKNVVKQLPYRTISSGDFPVHEEELDGDK